jgi:hypothetical protein
MNTQSNSKSDKKSSVNKASRSVAASLAHSSGNGLSLSPPVQRKSNTTGLPDQLKEGVEQHSGFSMDDVKVHFNSSKPAQLNALAFAQGTDIHVGTGQEKHLPHEAWHVVQQKQGRVKPTMQLKSGVKVNDDAGLEEEADRMGIRALEWVKTDKSNPNYSLSGKVIRATPALIQRKKNQMPDWDILKNVMSSAAKGKNSEEEKQIAVWNQCQTRYNKAKEKGYQREQDIDELKWKFSLGKNGVADDLEEVRKKYDETYKNSYLTHVRPNTGDGPVSISTIGYDGIKPPDDIAKVGQYDNRIDLEGGTILADNNKATEDPAREAGKGLSNSEILWNQYHEVAKTRMEPEKIPESMANISKVIRVNVSNETSLQVVFMAYPDGDKWIGHGKEDWNPGEEEYAAILGTPNAMGAAYLLIDHFDELGGKTLGIITTEPVGNGLDIIINFNDPEKNDQGQFNI